MSANCHMPSVKYDVDSALQAELKDNTALKCKNTANMKLQKPEAFNNKCSWLGHW